MAQLEIQRNEVILSNVKYSLPGMEAIVDKDIQIVNQTKALKNLT